MHRRRTLRSLLAPVALATACAPCHSWDEVQRIDRAQLDDGEGLATVEAAIATFIDWTGRETTCVDKVKVRELTKPGKSRESGFYRPQLRNVVIDHKDDEWRMWDPTLHELCHAADHEEGFISLDHAEALEPYTEDLNEDSYRTPNERTLEAFARICDEGPRLHPMWREMDQRCGDGYLDPGYRAVHDVMFGAQERSAELEDFEASVDSWELAGLDTGEGEDGASAWGPLVTGADGVFMLDTLYARDEQGSWVAYQHVVRRIDPDTATVLLSVELDPVEPPLEDAQGNPTILAHALLGSTAQPILVDRYDPGVAWRVHSDPVELEPITIPGFVEGASVEGFEHDGRLLVSIDDGTDTFLATAAIGETSWTTIDLEGLLPDLDELQAFDADEEGALIVYTDDGEPTVASLTGDGTLAWTRGLGLEGDSTHTFTVNRLPDGSVLASPWVSVSGDTNKLFPLRYDPATDRVSAPTSDCHTLRYYLDGVSWDGGYWMVYRPDLDDGGQGPLTLLGLVVEPR